jgi:hypothetical protein
MFLNKINLFPRKEVYAMKNVFLLSFRIIILLELAPLHYCRLLGVIGPVPRPLSIRAYLFF